MAEFCKICDFRKLGKTHFFQACGTDKACILDVFLTKDLAFANTSKTMTKMKEEVESVAVEFKEKKQNVVSEIREEKKRKNLEKDKELEARWRDAYEKMKLAKP